MEEATFIAIAAARSASGRKDNDMKPLVEELKRSIAFIIYRAVEDIQCTQFCATTTSANEAMDQYLGMDKARPKPIILRK